MPNVSQRFMRAAFLGAHRRGLWCLLAVFVALIDCAVPAAASHDPNRTVTVYVHGFERDGSDRHGVYGVDVHEDLADSLAAMVGLTAADSTGGPILPNALTATTYYGDTAPSYYTAADRAEIDRLTALWGGGVPRYAYIVARFAQHALERSGADQVNFVSGSLGSLVVRWLIEKDVVGLASTGRIARWLSVEGLIAGNWPASRGALLDYLEYVFPEPIDVDHMAYDWVSANLHSPRTEGDSPFYGGILIGQLASTDHRGNGAALSAAMLASDEYLPNDAVQAVSDAQFQTMTARSRLQGRLPTLALFHSDHLGIKDEAGAYAEAATFITARRRVTVTMTSARVTNLHEPQVWYWDWRPAEVVFESSVYSPAVQRRWGIGDPLSERLKMDTTAPLRRFGTTGETQTFSEVVFDDLVLPEETQLRIDLHAIELDNDPYYGVVETIDQPSDDDMGAGSVMVSTLQPGTYAFAAADWSCQLSVSVVEYPFNALLDVSSSSPQKPTGTLMIAPNPSVSNARITFAGWPPGLADAHARLEIADVAGRVVRVLDGSLRGGFLWDGCDAQGRPLPPGIYLHRAITAQGTWSGRSCRVR